MASSKAAACGLLLGLFLLGEVNSYGPPQRKKTTRPVPTEGTVQTPFVPEGSEPSLVPLPLDPSEAKTNLPVAPGGSPSPNQGGDYWWKAPGGPFSPDGKKPHGCTNGCGPSVPPSPPVVGCGGGPSSSCGGVPKPLPAGPGCGYPGGPGCGGIPSGTGCGSPGVPGCGGGSPLTPGAGVKPSTPTDYSTNPFLCSLAGGCRDVKPIGPSHGGSPGYPGAPGSPGSPGSPGFPGSSGTPGFPGSHGTPGFPGSPGSPGHPGSPGSHGTPGSPSSPGFPGSHGTPGSPGSPGFPGSHGTPGSPGSPGSPGFPGSHGTPGSPGSPGFPGSHGTPGSPGSPGSPGFPGSHGTPGSPGSPGFPGSHGTPGSPAFPVTPGTHGTSGYPGSPGSPGGPGSPATIGRPGILGYPDSQGKPSSQGTPGSPGYPGTPGFPGSHGTPGFPGTPGSPGAPGSPGSHGTPGSPGTPGAPGFPGSQGTPGSHGTPGAPGFPGSPGFGKPAHNGVPTLPKPQFPGSSISTTQRPYTGPLNTTPHPGCAAALKCVTIEYCTADGVMVDRPVVLTREEAENRVPLSDCINPDTGIIGKCCRDPNYKDPWPDMNTHPVDHGTGTHGGAFPKPPTGGTFPRPSGPGTFPSAGTTQPGPGFPAKPGTPSNPGFPQQPGTPGGQFPDSGFDQQQHTQFPQPGSLKPGVGGISPGFDGSQPGSGGIQQVPYPKPTPGFGQQPGSHPKPGFALEPPPAFGQPGSRPIPSGSLSHTPTSPSQPSFPSSQQQFPSQPSHPASQPGFPSSPKPFPSQPSGPSSQPGFPSQPSGPSSQPGFPSQPSGPSSQPGFPSQPSGPSSQPSFPSSQPGFPSSQKPFPQQPGFPSHSATPSQPSGGPFPSQSTSGTFPTPGSGESFPSQVSIGTFPSQPATPIHSDYHNAPYGICGVRRGNPTNPDVGPTEFGEFAWHTMILARANASRSALCSGAIVSEKAILTAAHCVAGLLPTDIFIRVSEWRPWSDSKTEEPVPVLDMDVIAIAKHPSFEPNSLFSDLAILFLAERLPSYKLGIEPVCIPGQPNSGTPIGGAAAPSSCLATSWGKATLSGADHSPLHKVGLNVIGHAACEQKLRQTYLGKFFILNQSFQCGVFYPINQPLTEIDDGSPLVCQTTDGRYILQGVGSWVTGSGPSQTSVFAQIDYAWILDTLSRPVEEFFPKPDEQNELIDTSKKPGFSQGYGRK